MDEFVASAPARANIIGEHTDYLPNRGKVLPTPLGLETTVRIRTTVGSSGAVIVSSTGFNEPLITRSLAGARMGHWSDYVVGCLKVAAEAVVLPPLRIEVDSRVPVGCGIGSSAALCVAVLRAVRGIAGTNWIDEDIALLAYHAEHDYVGVPCGQMDQFVSSLGRLGQAMLLDTKTLRSRNYRLDPRLDLMIVDSGSRRSMATGDGHRMRLQRLAECNEARKRLGVETLCELGYADLPLLSRLPGDIARRAWHVITENMRVLEFVTALEQRDLDRQADLLEASHVSQRDNFACSAPDVDALVETSKRFGVRGVRLAGGGFGGAVIAFVPREQAAEWWAFVSRENPESRLLSGDVLHQLDKEPVL